MIKNVYHETLIEQKFLSIWMINNLMNTWDLSQKNIENGFGLTNIKMVEVLSPRAVQLRSKVFRDLKQKQNFVTEFKYSYFLLLSFTSDYG